MTRNLTSIIITINFFKLKDIYKSTPITKAIANINIIHQRIENKNYLDFHGF
jgi:hypothetical protein